MKLLPQRPPTNSQTTKHLSLFSILILLQLLSLTSRQNIESIITWTCFSTPLCFALLTGSSSPSHLPTRLKPIFFLKTWSSLSNTGFQRAHSLMKLPPVCRVSHASISITSPIHQLCCAQSHLILCGSTDCSPPGSSIHETLQARILEWVAISYSRGIFPTQGLSPALAGRFFTTRATWKPYSSTRTPILYFQFPSSHVSMPYFFAPLNPTHPKWTLCNGLLSGPHPDPLYQLVYSSPGTRLVV